MIWKAATLWLVVSTATGQFTDEQKEQIVDLHNMYRSKVEPGAANMIRMKWDDRISQVAEEYAARCIWDHNQEISETFGENLFITTGSLNISKGLAKWFNEREHYDYYSDSCAPDRMCGHYTQMVWAQTTRLGCAAHLCDSVQGLDYKHAWMLVCDYQPQGNINGLKPYEEGESCSRCPDEKNFCIDDACGDLKEFTVEAGWKTTFTDGSILHAEGSVEPSWEMMVTDSPILKAVSSESTELSSATLLLLLTSLITSITTL